MRLYSDLDNTLIWNVTDQEGNVTAMLPRPGVGSFLEKLSRDGELWMLTAADPSHAERAMSVLHPYSKLFKGVLTRRDMEPVWEQLDIIFNDPLLDLETRWHLWGEVKPIAPRGVMFDDYPVGSGMFALKAASIGIGPDEWIEVEHFGEDKPDRGGLRKAYAEFRRRFPTMMMSGRKLALSAL